MTSREVVFSRPFVLHGFDRVEPAGTYVVETEEESIDDVSVVVWKRLATVIHLKHDTATEYVRIDPEDLRKAMDRDAGTAETQAALAARLATARGLPRTAVRRVTRRKF